MEVTILIPCLNEEKTVTACVMQAVTFLRDKNLKGEVLVVDNGSRDRTAELAALAGARVLSCKEKGYGNVLHYGIIQAKGEYVVMGDGDGSYHFSEAMPILDRLRDGADMVIGNRFVMPMEEGAMPGLHRWFGVPVLSFLGRCSFGVDVKDFHCGLRGVRQDSYRKLNCRCTGMEFATEMIGRAGKAGQRIDQVPVKLYRDGRDRPSHLRSVRDGLRHLMVICRLPLKGERKGRKNESTE